MKQNDILQNISDKDLKKSLLFSQALFLLISLLLSLILFDHFFDWFQYFKYDLKEMIYYGLFPGLLVVMIDLVLMKVLPKHHLDDGGMNERVFQNRSIPDILFLTLVIAISEELLFRGVFQTTFGYFTASVIFALVHFRYLKKPVLFISVLLLSFYIGFLFKITGNLFVTITMHFIIDFLLGLIIRFQKWGTVNE
ncbi:MAG TPA: CPBP family intramembrane glutamic endopeptidase [Candidatus Dormibacteraeota bacterium]|nr:CPBP family intramembrane glutamic endopeptidase [Candidatus Dormibacteraeota bacterium]